VALELATTGLACSPVRIGEDWYDSERELAAEFLEMAFPEGAKDKFFCLSGGCDLKKARTSQELVLVRDRVMSLSRGEDHADVNEALRLITAACALAAGVTG